MYVGLFHDAQAEVCLKRGARYGGGKEKLCVRQLLQTLAEKDQNFLKKLVEYLLTERGRCDNINLAADADAWRVG